VFDLIPKQKEFLFAKDKRLNFLVGSVRSGKTFISLWKFIFFVVSRPKKEEFIMVGKTITSLNRNCLGYILNFVGEDNFSYSISNKIAYLFGRKIWLEGANDESSEQKIRGMTLAGAYCDEVTLFPESFFVMLLSRLSLADAKLWATCNPDNPNHYIKEKYIEKTGLDLACWVFLLNENKFIADTFIDNLSKEYSGVHYQRFILGQWVRAEGIIYEKFANNTSDYLIALNSLPQLIQINVGVDFGGNKSASTFVCTGFTRSYKDVIILESERITGIISPDELEAKYVQFMKDCLIKYNRYIEVRCDSAEQILIKGLYRATQRAMLNAQVKNAIKMCVNDRIHLVNKLIGQGRFWVLRHNKTVIKALQDAIWKDNKNIAKDERLDNGTTDIDTLDAMEYSIEPNHKYLIDYIAR
jgi:PBSX family phage terminase large subunit